MIHDNPVPWQWKSYAEKMLLPILVCVVCAVPCRAEPVYDPVDAYERETIAGFSILIHGDVVTQAGEVEAMRRELRRQLEEIREVVPPSALARLEKVPIWVEWDKKPRGAAVFHPSAEWLRENGYNPEKAGCVEISNTRNFVRWSASDQPWMVMHELAHAYHFLVLGETHEGIADAHRRAIAAGIYRSVEHVDGRSRAAYAETNEKEYFAELTEAYYGKNDFFPFTRAELERHDPDGYRLMQATWEGRGAE